MLGDTDEDTAHDPTHQSRMPRLVLGLVAVVPAISLVLALSTDGATQVAIGYLNILWTALLMLVFGGWMIRTAGFSLDRKIAWAFAFILAAPITLPLYWYLHVWKAPTARVVHA